MLQAVKLAVSNETWPHHVLLQRLRAPVVTPAPYGLELAGDQASNLDLLALREHTPPRTGVSQVVRGCSVARTTSSRSADVGITDRMDRPLGAVVQHVLTATVTGGRLAVQLGRNLGQAHAEADCTATEQPGFEYARGERHTVVHDHFATEEGRDANRFTVDAVLDEVDQVVLEHAPIDNRVDHHHAQDRKSVV